MIEKKKISYAEAMDRSWPHGRFLVSLMESAFKVVSESVMLQAQRLAREKIDVEIALLQKQRDVIQSNLKRTCRHPSERMYVLESMLSETLKHYEVMCGTCDNRIKQFLRGPQGTEI